MLLNFRETEEISIYLSPFPDKKTMHRMDMLCFLAQSCPALCDPTDCHPPGSSVHGIL